jgi:UDP-4-amino-4-deoxy-L-arabinose formyltransferase/UDP-glucuronic acid dehydrogenase (UDP-4-keto-hexauronic acid decarboxylating)
LKISFIGRTEILYDSILLAKHQGHTISNILTAKEAPEYLKKREDFQRLAFELRTEYASGSNILDFSHFLCQGNPDIALSINYPGIIPQEIIDLFPLGILNAHGGDLPKYRGNACQSWAILNGEEKIGLCIHRMIGGELDSGDIVLREYMNLTQNTKVTDAWKWMQSRVPKMFLQAVDLLEKNPNYVLEKQSKNPKDALRCYPRMPEDGRIDWKKENIEILRLINASGDPYSGAYCEFDSKKLIIWDAELYEDEEIYLAIPGQIAEHNLPDGSIIAICGKGKLKIKEVTYEGRKGKPSEFIRTIRKRLV